MDGHTHRSTWVRCATRAGARWCQQAGKARTKATAATSMGPTEPAWGSAKNRSATTAHRAARGSGASASFLLARRPSTAGAEAASAGDGSGSGAHSACGAAAQAAATSA